ncbi:MAG: GTPase ObgE [Planctomycetota bacterium]
MFLDERLIRARSGRGGRGCVAFRREKFVPRGGPSGGDGGRGGSVSLEASSQLTTFFDMEDRVEHRAGDGEPGGGANRSGAAGRDVGVAVPVGPGVGGRDTGALLGDLDREGAVLTVARGGRGGRGNASFATSTDQAPRRATGGGDGEERWLRLELKLLADVGLVGLPNAGKSTLLRRLSRARPKVADYPFTTLEPYLGIVAAEGFRSFTLADLPGLIEGAHRGTGLGHRFLRHVERTRLLVHLVDLHADPAAAYRQVRAELHAYGQGLAQKPEIVAANKVDLGADEGALKDLGAAADREVVPISGATGEGLPALVRTITARL